MESPSTLKLEITLNSLSSLSRVSDKRALPQDHGKPALEGTEGATQPLLAHDQAECEHLLPQV